jgi:hypothetical protein
MNFVFASALTITGLAFAAIFVITPWVVIADFRKEFRYRR